MELTEKMIEEAIREEAKKVEEPFSPFPIIVNLDDVAKKILGQNKHKRDELKSLMECWWRGLPKRKGHSYKLLFNKRIGLACHRCPTWFWISPYGLSNTRYSLLTFYQEDESK